MQTWTSAKWAQRGVTSTPTALTRSVPTRAHARMVTVEMDAAVKVRSFPVDEDRCVSRNGKLFGAPVHWMVNVICRLDPSE